MHRFLIPYSVVILIIPLYHSALTNKLLPNSSQIDNVITLADGNKFTGIDLHLPVPFMDPIRAYFGIRYSSLGPVSSKESKFQVNSNSTKWSSIPMKPATKRAVLHRFSHSVASFFYEAPSGIQPKTLLPPVCPQSQLNLWPKNSEVPKLIKERLLRISPFLKQQTEDCLTLNIFVPKTNSRRSYQTASPVLLFVHGETYEVGSGNAYDLSVLASYSGAICITFNYRLGLFGFFTTSTDESSGNFALFDLYAAIMWIKTNVASFGGDPNEITIMGYGYGAALVHLFSLSKMCQGISDQGIKRLILLNGSGFAPWATARQTRSLLTELATKLNITLEDENPKKMQHNTTHTMPKQILHEINPKKSSQLINSHLKSKVKSLFEPNPTPDSSHNNLLSSPMETSSAHSVSNQTVNQTRAQKITIQAKLFNLLKHLPTDLILELQENLTHLAYGSNLGPVITPHLFPNYMVRGSNFQGDREIRQHRHQLDQTKPMKPEIELNLFHKADLLVGFTEEPAIELLYQTMQGKTDDKILDDLVSQTYPHNHRAIKEVLKHIYCRFEGKQNRNSEENKGCRKELLSLLSDGLFKSPIIQTIKLHNHFKGSGKSGSTYAFLFKHMSATRSSLVNPKMDSILVNALTQTGYGDDLAYYLGAPLVSPNQLEPFPNNYLEKDRTIARKFMSVLSSFIHYGDPNKGVVRPNNAKFPIHWPEYTLDKQLYLVVGQNYDSTQDHTRPNSFNLWGQENKHNRFHQDENDFFLRQGYKSEKMTLWSHLLPTLATYPDNTVKSKKREGQIEKSSSPDQNYFYFLRLQEIRNEDSTNQTSSQRDSHIFDPKLIEKECEKRSKENDLAKTLNGDHDPVIKNATNLIQTQIFIKTTTSVSPAIIKQESSPVSESQLWQQGNYFPTASNQVSPSTRSALLWTIAVGSTLFILNALVFAAVYYQAHQIHCPYKRDNRNKPVTIIPGNSNRNYLNGVETSVNLIDHTKKQVPSVGSCRKVESYTDEHILKPAPYCINPSDNLNLLKQLTSETQHERINPLTEAQPDNPDYKKQNIPICPLIHSQTLHRNLGQGSNNDWIVDSPSVLRFPKESGQHQSGLLMGVKMANQQNLDQSIKSYVPFQ